MGSIAAATATATTSRFIREDFRRTKHDSSFSKWQILIGPLDWENFELGKEGAERYRVGNLPKQCGPGLYEIGVAVNRSGSGRDIGKLESDRIVVVYLGQADNVRSRLQHYGRSGSHLVRHRCSAVPESTGENGYRTGFFKEIFSTGFPIVYRWAPMKSKGDAERMETKLLETFDYAWNKVGNGSRRPNDVLNKIDKISTKNKHIPKFLKMLQSLTDQKVGIPIKLVKPAKSSNHQNHENHDSSFNFLGRVFKFSRSQPRLVPQEPYIFTKESDQDLICGVHLDDGSTCSKQPVVGRKRCVEHKGRRITKNSIVLKASPQDNDVAYNLSPICGVVENNGNSCQTPPNLGRKRCEKHKGMRLNQTVSELSTTESTFVVDISILNLRDGDHCGVHLGEGKYCGRQPVKERKRCEGHKGMRVDACIAVKLLSRN